MLLRLIGCPPGAACADSQTISKALNSSQGKDAAEKYGYIVAGSNNSRNGPIQVVEAAVGAMLHDTESRYSLNPRRYYLAGFSGGARVAVAVGFALQGKVAGIFACGAGFPPSITPDASIPFAFFGAAGNDDFNYPEPRRLDSTLQEFAIPHEFERFQGDYVWAPETVCMHALEWMELQAMKSGIRERDQALIEELFAAKMAEAHALENANRAYEAFLCYASIARGFQGLRDSAPHVSKAKQLEQSREVRKALEQQKDVEERQRRMQMHATRLADDALSGDNRQSAAQEFRSLIHNLNRNARQTGNEVNRSAAVRVLASFWVGLNEAASEDFQQREFRRAAVRLELMAWIRPDHPQVEYQLARAHALSGNRKAAIAALQNAVRKGFADLSALEGNRDMDILRKEPAFREIIEDLKAKKKAAAARSG